MIRKTRLSWNIQLSLMTLDEYICWSTLFLEGREDYGEEKRGSFYHLREMKRGISAAFRCRLVIMTHVRYERITAAFEIHKKEEGNNEKGKRM